MCALGWALALPWTYLGPNLVPDGSSALTWIALFALFGAIAGLTLALVTGASIRWLPPRPA